MARALRPRPPRSLVAFRKQRQGSLQPWPPEPPPPASPAARRPSYYQCPECLGELVSVVGHGTGRGPLWMCRLAIGEQVRGPLGPSMPDYALHSMMRYYRESDLGLLEREYPARTFPIEVVERMTA